MEQSAHRGTNKEQPLKTSREISSEPTDFFRSIEAKTFRITRRLKQTGPIDD